MSIKIKKSNDVLIIMLEGQMLSAEEATEAASEMELCKNELLVLDLTRLNDIGVDALKILAAAAGKTSGAKAAILGSFNMVKLLKNEGLAENFAYVEENISTEVESFLGEYEKAFNESFDTFTKVVTASVIKIFKEALYTEVTLESRSRDLDAPPFETELGAVVDLISEPFSGSILLSFQRETFDILVKRLFKDLDADKIDAAVFTAGAAEILNMINGRAKGVLNQKGYSIEGQVPPETVEKESLFLRQSGFKTFTLIFHCDVGKFFVETIASPR